jgi:L-fuculose-phosphate aldolase
MLMAADRESIVHHGRKMVQVGLTSGTGGNISVIDRAAGHIAISPSGLDYFETEAEDIVVTDLDGTVVEGKRKPSSELQFHRAVYRARPDAVAVVHTHSVYATTVACLGEELPAVHYMIGYSGDKVPLAPYSTFGTDALATAVEEGIRDYNALLLANHGVIAMGNNLPTAFAAAEAVEFVARIWLQARSVGTPVILSQAEMAVVVDKFASYGQK